MKIKSSLASLSDYIERLRIFLLTVFKTIIFFGGLVLAVMAFLAAMILVTNRYKQYQLLIDTISALATALFVIFILYMYFKSYRHKSPLDFNKYLLFIFIIACLTFIGFCISSAIFPFDKHPTLDGFTFALISSFVGIALTWVAHLEPPVHQQVQYVARKALKKAPNQQLSSIELIQYLKKTWKLSAETLLQYLDDCTFLENLDDPTTHLRFYRIKGEGLTLPFTQILSINNVNIRNNIQRALSHLNEENVDIGLLMLGREFETTLKDYLIKAHAKGKLTTTPNNKAPQDLKNLADLVSCLKSNGIVTDDATLSYLRQQRNDRAHGRTPSLAERQLMMRNVQHLASLYIDYIKFFDDLMQEL